MLSLTRVSHVKLMLPVFLCCLFNLPTAFATNPTPPAVFVEVQSVVPATGLSGPTGLATDAAGNLYIADTYNNRVVKITPAGVQSTVLSGTVAGAALSSPHSLAFDSAGNLYVADSGNNRVLEIAPNNTATTVGTVLSNPMGVAAGTESLERLALHAPRHHDLEKLPGTILRSRRYRQ